MLVRAGQDGPHPRDIFIEFGFSKRLEQVEIVHPNAAGLDIGRQEIYACVPPDRTGETVQTFGTFTPDLNRLADWLIANTVDTVAMESTGVYWIGAFELLAARSLKVYLVNGRPIKHVPGRKSDVQDCQWIQKLHALGLLNGSFRPDAEMCALRQVSFAFKRTNKASSTMWVLHVLRIPFTM